MHCVKHICCVGTLFPISSLLHCSVAAFRCDGVVHSLGKMTKHAPQHPCISNVLQVQLAALEVRLLCFKLCSIFAVYSCDYEVFMFTYRVHCALFTNETISRAWFVCVCVCVCVPIVATFVDVCMCLFLLQQISSFCTTVVYGNIFTLAPL